MATERWFFTKENLNNTPSQQRGYTPAKELLELQWASFHIQKMGRRMKLNLLCINTAVVYLRRFYMCHPMQLFPCREITTAALFLAAKVEEHMRKVDDVLEAKRHVFKCADRDKPGYNAATEIVFNENLLLRTLGFQIQVDHAHKYVLDFSEKFNIGRTLTSVAYALATAYLHLSCFYLVYKPNRIAYLCIHMAQKFTDTVIPLSRNEGKPWYKYCDESLTEKILDELMDEFLALMPECPPECKAFSMTSLPQKLVSQVQPLPFPSDPAKAGPSRDKAKKEDQDRARAQQAKQAAADERSHDPNKHFRKLIPTPPKNPSKSDHHSRPPHIPPNHPKRHVKIPSTIPNFESRVKSEDLRQSANAVPHRPRENSQPPHIRAVTATTPDLPREKSQPSHIHAVTATTPDLPREKSQPSHVRAVTATTPDLPREKSQPSHIRGATADLPRQKPQTPHIRAATATNPDLSREKSQPPDIRAATVNNQVAGDPLIQSRPSTLQNPINKLPAKTVADVTKAQSRESKQPLPAKQTSTDDVLPSSKKDVKTESGASTSRGHSTHSPAILNPLKRAYSELSSSSLHEKRRKPKFASPQKDRHRGSSAKESAPPPNSLKITILKHRIGAFAIDKTKEVQSHERNVPKLANEEREHKRKRFKPDSKGSDNSC